MSYMDMFSLKGKVALVTGGSYGIGFAIARAYARAGARIAFNCRSQEHLDTAMAAYAKEGIDAKGLTSHLYQENTILKIIQA